MGGTIMLALSITLSLLALPPEPMGKFVSVPPLDLSGARGQVRPDQAADIEEMLQDVSTDVLGDDWTVYRGGPTTERYLGGPVVRAGSMLQGRVVAAGGQLTLMIRLVRLPAGSSSDCVLRGKNAKELRAAFARKVRVFFARAGLIQLPTIAANLRGAETVSDATANLRWSQECRPAAWVVLTGAEVASLLGLEYTFSALWSGGGGYISSLLSTGLALTLFAVAIPIAAAGGSWARDGLTRFGLPESGSGKRIAGWILYGVSLALGVGFGMFSGFALLPSMLFDAVAMGLFQWDATEQRDRLAEAIDSVTPEANANHVRVNVSMFAMRGAAGPALAIRW